jgi:hypothetical protein
MKVVLLLLLSSAFLLNMHDFNIVGFARLNRNQFGICPVTLN